MQMYIHVHVKRYLHNALADIMRTILPVTTPDPQRDSTANTAGRGKLSPGAIRPNKPRREGVRGGTIARLGTFRVHFHDPSEHQFLAWDVMYTFLQDLLSDLQPSTGITASLQMRTDLLAAYRSVPADLRRLGNPPAACHAPLHTRVLHPVGFRCSLM